MRWRTALVGLAAVAAICVAALWFARRSIADDAIAAALAKAGVAGRYKVSQIGFGWQRLERITLGDPARPDLTADWAEVRLAAGWNGISADAIRAGGVRLHGRVVNGKVSWGTIDRLLPASQGGSPMLPAIDVTLDDARLALATPWGPVSARFDGRGRLDDGFAGKLAAMMPRLSLGDCRIEGVTADLDVAIRRGSPIIRGPLRGQSLACPGVTVNAPRANANIVVGLEPGGWRGTITPEADRLSFSGGFVTALRGQVTFSSTPDRTRGTARVTGRVAMIGDVRLGDVGADSAFNLAKGQADARGVWSVGRAALPATLLDRLGGIRIEAAGTPVAPFVDALADAAVRAGQDAVANGRFSASFRNGRISANVANAAVTTKSGATLRLMGGRGIGFDGRAIIADAQISLSGGGFPAIVSNLWRTADGVLRGTARAAPFVAGKARLSLTPVDFLARGDGYGRMAGVATFDGPVAGGRVAGLRTPLLLARLGDGSIVVNPGCAPLRFASLRVQGLTLGATSISLCASGGALLRYTGGRLSGGAVATAPQLIGTIGQTPLSLAATKVRIGLGGGDIAATGIAARLGTGDRVSRLDIGSLTGDFRGGAFAGKFSGLSGQIGKVPLLIDRGAGDWRQAGGALDLTGMATVADDNPAPRFNPLTVDALKLRFLNNRIVATAILREPRSATEVAAIDLSHDLAIATGRATLAVAGMRFDDGFQPEAITRLTLGIVANVRGTVGGWAALAWDGQGVTSTGRFSSTGLNFAAAFGPVDGAAGEIVFTDLLGLVTAPGQLVTLASVNPGVPVPGGRVAYHLAPGQRIIVERGEWPFAGGQLLLEPTTFEMDARRERRLTFRVVGLDAAKFIETLQVDNLAATGLFDGTIPMVFDSDGGRIEHGMIVARPGGGSLAYVGEVSNTQMNVYGKMAFDALKAIRYSNLAIRLDGPLDGEMVSNVSFRGVNQDPAAKPKGIVARAIKGLPFRFNIVIRAPFRSLLATARDLQDPSALIRRSTPLPPAPLPQSVQPAESEKR